MKELTYFHAQKTYVIISYQLLTSAQKQFYVQKLVSGTDFVVSRRNNFESFWMKHFWVASRIILQYFKSDSKKKNKNSTNETIRSNNV